MRKVFVLCLVIGMAVAAGAVWAADAAKEKGLVAYWSFDEGKGEVAKDASANKLEAVLNGASWTKGKSGSALGFDGEGAYVEVEDNEVFGLGSSFTVELWFKYAAEGTVDKLYWTLLNKNSGGDGNADPYHFMVNATTGFFHCRVADGVSNYEISSDISISDGKFHHGALVFNDELDKYCLYLDGKEVRSQSVPGTWVPCTNIDPLIFGYWTAYGNYFNGTMDEVRIYSRALTADEIKAHYGTASK